jgi:membrane-associated phospholipid phosphatase
MKAGPIVARSGRWLVGHAYWLLPLTALVLAFSAYVDRPVARFFKASDPRDVAFFVALNDGGNSQWYLVPAGILAILSFGAAALLAVDRRRVLRWIGEASLFLFASVAVSGIVVNVLKLIFARSRPRVLFSRDEYAWHFFHAGSDVNSFPSGHANTMIALALALAYLVPRARWLFLTIAVPIAFARVVNTNHYLSDVIAGSAVAVLTAPLIHAWFAQRGWVFELRPKGARVKAEGRLALARLARPLRPFGRLWP